MNNVDYFFKIKLLAHEAYSFKKYKHMDPALAVFMFILTLPIFIFFSVNLLGLFVLGIFFNLLQTPIKYIHGIVREEGQVVKHATQFIIYFISWPLIFLLYLLISLTTFLLFVSYLVTSFAGYYWTLGGYKFHLFITDEDIAINVDKKIPNRLPLGYVIVALIVILSLAVFAIVIGAQLNTKGTSNAFMGRFYMPLLCHESFFVLYTLIYIPLAFNNTRQALAKPIDGEAKIPPYDNRIKF